MKKSLLLSICYLTISLYCFAQNGGYAINLTTNSSVTVPDNSNGSLDVSEAHTIELWFKANNVQNDQKLFSKIGGDLKNGYILGIENNTVKYEIFDDNGDKKELIAATVYANRWTHLAASYQKGDKMKLYLNGVLVGETTDNGSEVSYTTNQLTIGTNSWGAGLLSFAGEIDQVRYWDSALSEETISNWMHRRVTSDHPNEASLQLYHKYNEGSGQSVDDSSQQTNVGTFTAANWTTSTIPFKDWQYFAIYGPVVGAIWNGHESFTSEILTINSPGFVGDESVIIESNTQQVPYSYCNTVLPNGIDLITCLIWHASVQGNPNISLSFDLSNYDLTNVSDIVLLESPTLNNDLSNATIIQGSLNGSNFELNNFPISSEKFYILGFTNTPTVSTYDLDQTVDFNISPNPSQGIFQVTIHTEEANNFQLEVLDYTGKSILKKQLQNLTAYQERFDLSYLTSGMYILQLSTDQATIVQKLVLH